MKIRHVRIENFRGIKKLDWRIASDFVCLVGPGDARKTSILDAIDLVLNGRPSFNFDDSDFYGLETSATILIRVSLVEFPNEFLDEAKFGLCMCGYRDGEVHDAFQDGDQEMLTVSLSVDSSLEPKWTVVNSEHPDGLTISWRDRDKLGVTRLGSYLNHHFTWRRGTMLSRITGKPDDIDLIVAEANRAARKVVDTGDLVQMKTAAKKAERLAREIGVLPQGSYAPNLDAGGVSIGEGAFSLHEGEVPIRRAGLGARRLLVMAVQAELAESGGIVLVDEFEHGLEPHRIRHLLRSFRNRAKCNSFGQVIITSHSPVVAEEMPDTLHVVRPGASVTVLQAPDTLVATIRRAADALLGRKVIVCEGSTEQGICRALDEDLISQDHMSMACRGVVLVRGEGTSSPRVSKDLRTLGYDVLHFGDSDRSDVKAAKPEMERLGIVVLLWQDDLAIEQRIFRDLPWPGVLEAVALASEEKGDGAIRQAITARLDEGSLGDADANKWTESQELRRAIGDAAKKGGWYKRIGLGESLGRVIMKNLPLMKVTDTAKKVEALTKWAEE